MLTREHSLRHEHAHIWMRWQWRIAHYNELQQSPSIFHEHPSSFSSLFHFLYHSGMFSILPLKKVSFLSICSQTIAGVRQYRQKKWEEREKKEIREREREKKRLEGFGENRGLMGDEQQRWGSSCLWATFLPVFHTFTCSTVAALSRLCKSLSSEEKASHSWGNKDKKRGCFQER